MNKQKWIYGIDRAHSFWGLAKNGKLEIECGEPRVWNNKSAADACACDGEEVVKVYLVVEDK